jgi:hypothetical protein
MEKMMTYINYFVNAFYQSIDTVFSSIDKGFRARRAYEELNRLNDRELKDLGIARYDIPRIVFDSVKTQSFR